MVIGMDYGMQIIYNQGKARASRCTWWSIGRESEWAGIVVAGSFRARFVLSQLLDLSLYIYHKLPTICEAEVSRNFVISMAIELDLLFCHQEFLQEN